MSSTANFASTPAAGAVLAQISVANTNRDGTGTLVDVITAAAAGTRVDALEIVATGTTTAGVVRLFQYDGTNNRLFKEILVTAITPSTTTAVWSTTYVFDPPLVIRNASWKLKASTHNAETFNICPVMVGDLT
jgi:hypothetical protein